MNLNRFLNRKIVLVIFFSFSFTGLLFADTHELAGKSVRVEFVPSPNKSDRPVGVLIDTIVLHASERRTLQDVIRVFSSKRFQTSAHYSIGKDGRVIQHVRESEKAWHAGESKMPDGRERVNEFSIGIELINRNDGFDSYPLPQRRALKQLVSDLKGRYPNLSIVTHAEIAWPRGRKSDPKGFQMRWLE